MKNYPEFPQDKDLYYLNHAAVSPWPARTARAVTDFANENVARGAAAYPVWLKKERLLRQQICDLINAPTLESIALLKNTSEAISVVAEGIDWNTGDNVVTTSEEFPSNRIPWQAQSRHGVELREVDLGAEPGGEQALMAACNRDTRVLTVSSVQFGSGYKLDLDVLGRYCRQKNILFCVDAIQSIGAHALDVQQCDADFVMADAHKWMMGPEGIALFYCREERLEQLRLHQYGWHMVENAGNYDIKEWTPAPDARRFECGSPNMLGIHAMSASLSLLLEVGMDNIEQQISIRVDSLVDALGNDARFDIITPEDPRRRAGIVNFRPVEHDAAELHKALIARGVICAHRGGGIRFSPHFYTTTETINKVLEIINIIY